MMTNYLQKAEKFEIQTYKKPRSVTDLKQTHVAFSGSLFKHPYDMEKIILLAEPYNSNTFYYEFKTGDISYMEELPNIVNPEGDMLNITRIWVKKEALVSVAPLFWLKTSGLYKIRKQVWAFHPHPAKA